ncbi:MAG: nucleotidyl transferase AbiEii/AbiGii toxin family protein [Bacteroidales bacterium]|nr:nucleotidyl transferase AbiEii/AbiGii toxin family protein [Bacteroidales bacterium]MDD3859529.1 nucleotidyl transferase AbiEii/AbiGii toxin family protein [Bacteroidales bacterium]
MQNQVLKEEQVKLLPLLKLFGKDFYLVGGTAIALHLCHRYSLDYDLFTSKIIKHRNIKNILKKNNFDIEQILFEDSIQLHCIINKVKITFFQFPYSVKPRDDFKGIIKIPDLKTLAAMKAFALGSRAKWKDYVDLYFIFKNHFSLKEVTELASNIFKDSFNEKLFRQQLTYFDDISYEEEVEYLNEPVNQETIKTFLTELAITQI